MVSRFVSVVTLPKCDSKCPSMVQADTIPCPLSEFNYPL
jgi:hypothetical protein